MVAYHTIVGSLTLFVTMLFFSQFVWRKTTSTHANHGTAALWTIAALTISNVVILPVRWDGALLMHIVPGIAFFGFGIAVFVTGTRLRDYGENRQMKRNHRKFAWWAGAMLILSLGTAFLMPAIRKSTIWWLPHLWVIAMQVGAFVPYCLGSWRFYKRRPGFMTWLWLGIALDVVMAISASTGLLPRMKSEQGAPWHSVLFLTHITTAGLGMFFFLGMVVCLAIRGTDYEYPRLRRVQYLIFLRAWMFGVSIALVNFLWKIVYNQRIYDWTWQMLR